MEHGHSHDHGEHEHIGSRPHRRVHGHEQSHSHGVVDPSIASTDRGSHDANSSPQIAGDQLEFLNTRGEELTDLDLLLHFEPRGRADGGRRCLR